MSNTITPTVFYRTINVEELEFFYREAGPGNAPTRRPTKNTHSQPTPWGYGVAFSPECLISRQTRLGKRELTHEKTRPEQKAQHCAAACAALMSMLLTLRCCCGVAGRGAGVAVDLRSRGGTSGDVAAGLAGRVLIEGGGEVALAWRLRWSTGVLRVF
jgi:hypothetical protein